MYKIFFKVYIMFKAEIIKLNKIPGDNFDSTGLNLNSRFKLVIKLSIILHLCSSFRLTFISKVLDFIVSNKGFELLFIRIK